jgi:hypothetical protein
MLKSNKTYPVAVISLGVLVGAVALGACSNAPAEIPADKVTTGLSNNSVVVPAESKTPPARPHGPHVRTAQELAALPGPSPNLPGGRGGGGRGPIPPDVAANLKLPSLNAPNVPGAGSGSVSVGVGVGVGAASTPAP